MKSGHGTVKSYVTGFILSLVFTAIPYYLVVQKSLSGNVLLATILGFAVVQLVIQVVFFLHLGREPRPRYNLVFFAGTIGTIVFIAVASIWIMNHLNYNMSPQQMETKVIEKEGIHH